MLQRLGMALTGLTLTALTVTQLGARQVSVIDGGLQMQGGRQFTIWANSPQAGLFVSNASGRFLHFHAHFRNVPKGAYLATPQGVADAASLGGGTLKASLAVPGGSQGRWRLESNVKGDYRFAVVGGPFRYLSLLSRTPQARHLAFVIHLGDGVYPGRAAIDVLSRYHFPTYLLPGPRTPMASFQHFIGSPDQAFAIGDDRFLFLDDRLHVLGPSKLAWLQGELAEFREHRAGRIFVFLSLPLVDPRRYHSDALWRLAEVHRLLAMFRTYRVTGVFAGELPLYDHQELDGTHYVIAGGSNAALVQIKGHHTLIHVFPL